MVLGMHHFKSKKVEELYHGLLNLILKIIYNGDYYCFCDEYHGCEKKYGQRNFCPLCRIAYDFNDIETMCDFAQCNWDKLTEICEELFPYFKEIFQVKPYYDDIYRDLLFCAAEFNYSHRDNYTGQKHETSLTEMTEMLENTKIRMGTYKYFKSKYGCTDYKSYLAKYRYSDSD